ncbi:MAG: hypothetical protein JSV88_04145 [Candidatus Aminicenantes bacterium]|nr:MAG: hypothetical protein JSV88_04145 [Candidatus Aminicenantes bacterium]
MAIVDETDDLSERVGDYTILITSDNYSLGDYVQIKDEDAKLYEKLA